MANGLDGVRPWWRDKKDGSVYLLRSESGLLKIGKTTRSLEKRISTLTGMSPVKLFLVHSISCVDCHSFERKLHLKFAAKRDHGEWFSLTQEEVDWIKSATEKEL